MRSLTAFAAALTLMLGVTVAATRSPTLAHHRSINACLRRHGWPWGLHALERAEIRVKHPNGLENLCVRHDDPDEPH